MNAKGKKKSAGERAEARVRMRVRTRECERRAISGIPQWKNVIKKVFNDQ